MSCYGGGGQPAAGRLFVILFSANQPLKDAQFPAHGPELRSLSILPRDKHTHPRLPCSPRENPNRAAAPAVTMKPPSPAASSPTRSPRAGGARATCSMKRPRKARRSLRAASQPSQAIRAPRLRQICLGGMPAWVPSLLGGLRLQHGRSNRRWAGGPPLELRRRRGGRNRDRDAAAGGVRGGRGDEEAPGRGGGAPAGVDLLDDKTEDLVQYGMTEGVHPVLLDIDRWIGKIDKDDLPGKDEPALYLPYYLSEKGEPDDGEAEGAAVCDMSIDLAETYSMMLDNYVEINRLVADKWKLKTNLDKLPWSVVRREVKKIDVELKTLVVNYKCLQKQSVTLMEQISDLSVEPLQPPLLLKHGHGPDQFDAKKEKKQAMKVQVKAEKKKRKEDYKKLSAGKEKAKKVGKSGKESKLNIEKDVQKKRKDDKEGKARHNTEKDIQKKPKEDKECRREKKRKK